jgi:hypothetical protein
MENFMLKKLLKNPYIISAVIVFLLLFFLGIFEIGFSLTASLLVSAVISIVAVGGYWWKEKVWP